MDGPSLLASWNNARGFCMGTAVQGFGWSANGGLTWTDGGDPAPLPGGGRWRGDPLTAVDRKLHAFYLAGLYEGGAAGSGVIVRRGHIAGGVFVTDVTRQIAFGGSNFLDKPWMAVDSLTGNVYVSWTDFQLMGGGQIELQVLDPALNALGPIQVMNAPAANDLVQGSRPCVGPDGRVYVVWYEYGFPLSVMKIRRSLDHGVTFEPEVAVATFYENSYSGAPGYRRGFAPTLPGIACDVSNGPFRGRVYVTWDETLNFYDAAFPTTPVQVESESNDFFARATPFTVGTVLRGIGGETADVDLWRFEATAGQTFVLRTDSTSTNIGLIARILCAGDTSTFNDYRILAYTLANPPALCWSAPVTGTYYLRLSFSSPAPGPYKMSTTFDVPGAGDRARANRDHFVATSDDGLTWSTPRRMNDNAPGSDGIFAEIAVDDLGRAHCYWHDFRDDPLCGAESVEYVTSSGDGGVTWGTNRALSDALSFWSFNACGSANQGDYQGITAQGSRVAALWADSRLGDPDVWAEVSDHRSSVDCAGPSTVLAGRDTTLAVAVINDGSVEETLGWQVTDTDAWIQSVTPSAAGVALVGPGGGSVHLQVHLHTPPGCVGTSDRVIVRQSNLLIPGEASACTLTVNCSASVGVEGGPVAALRFDAPRPNPSGGDCLLSFALPAATRVRLALFSVSGARVRTLVDGPLPAGEVARRWDGRDDAGRTLPPGTYFARLEAGAERLRRTVILAR